MTNNSKSVQWIGTGLSARLLGTTETQLADLIRRGKISPSPPIVAGRRQWDPVHVLQAAEHLGVRTDELRESLAQESRDAF